MNPSEHPIYRWLVQKLASAYGRTYEQVERDLKHADVKQLIEKLHGLGY